MKLHIRKNAFIGDPRIGAELEIVANDKVFDIEVIEEQMFSKVWISEFDLQ